jgi:hypothetical protein
MTTQFECVNCGRRYPADKLSKCPVCSASGPMIPKESNLNQAKPIIGGKYLDDGQKFLWKAGGTIFALLVAGSWIWSWIFPDDPNRYNLPTPAPTETIAPSIGQGTSSYYEDPCEDAPTVEDYLWCVEDGALEDWKQDREAEAGLP